MSRHNKVNPDHYTMAGRLSSDDLARERMRQGEHQPGGGRRGRRRATPPWMANETPTGGMDADTDRHTNDDAVVTTGDASVDEGAGLPRRQAAQKRGAASTRKGKRPAPRRKATGTAPGRAANASAKASGARGTPKTRKAPTARGSAARGASPQRAARPAARRGRTKGSGTTRRAQKKGGAKAARKSATGSAGAKKSASRKGAATKRAAKSRKR